MMQSSYCDAYPLIKKQIPYHLHCLRCRYSSSVLWF